MFFPSKSEKLVASIRTNVVATRERLVVLIRRIRDYLGESSQYNQELVLDRVDSEAKERILKTLDQFGLLYVTQKVAERDTILTVDVSPLMKEEKQLKELIQWLEKEKIRLKSKETSRSLERLIATLKSYRMAPQESKSSMSPEPREASMIPETSTPYHSKVSSEVKNTPSFLSVMSTVGSDSHRAFLNYNIPLLGEHQRKEEKMEKKKIRHKKDVEVVMPHTEGAGDGLPLERMKLSSIFKGFRNAIRKSGTGKKKGLTRNRGNEISISFKRRRQCDMGTPANSSAITVTSSIPSTQSSPNGRIQSGKRKALSETTRVTPTVCRHNTRHSRASQSLLTTKDSCDSDEEGEGFCSKLIKLLGLRAPCKCEKELRKELEDQNKKIEELNRKLDQCIYCIRASTTNTSALK